MIKLVEKAGIKQVYSDRPNGLGHAEINAFFIVYVNEKNTNAWTGWIRHTKARTPELWFFEVSGKYFDTLTQADVDAFNKDMEVT